MTELNPTKLLKTPRQLTDAQENGVLEWATDEWQHGTVLFKDSLSCFAAQLVRRDRTDESNPVAISADCVDAFLY